MASGQSAEIRCPKGCDTREAPSLVDGLVMLANDTVLSRYVCDCCGTEFWVVLSNAKATPQGDGAGL